MKSDANAKLFSECWSVNLLLYLLLFLWFSGLGGDVSSTKLKPTENTFYWGDELVGLVCTLAKVQIPNEALNY